MFATFSVDNPSQVASIYICVSYISPIYPFPFLVASLRNIMLIMLMTFRIEALRMIVNFEELITLQICKRYLF